jgi:DNA-binding response OmpR family regulator
MHFPDRIDTAASSEPLPLPSSPAGAASPGGSILLVDDEPTLRGLTQRVLTRAGYQVAAAGDAGEARALLERQACDPLLLITDLELPGVSGWELARGMLAQRPKLAVLYISGRGDEERLRARIESEGQLLLAKPFTTQMLLEQVRRALARV